MITDGCIALRIDWNKIERINNDSTVEAIIFNATRKIIELRNKFDVFSDLKNTAWINPHIHSYCRLYTLQRKANFLLHIQF